MVSEMGAYMSMTQHFMGTCPVPTLSRYAALSGICMQRLEGVAGLADYCLENAFSAIYSIQYTLCLHTGIWGLCRRKPPPPPLLHTEALPSVPGGSGNRGWAPIREMDRVNGG